LSDLDCYDQIEFKEFSSLAAEVAQGTGADPLRLPPGSVALAAIAHACEQLPDGSSFGHAAALQGVHRKVQEALHDLHHWGWTADTIRDAASEVSPHLAARLRDLSEIDTISGSVLADLGFRSAAGQLAVCLDAEYDRDGAFDRLIVWAGAEFTPLQTLWLQWLAKQGVEVTVIAYRHAFAGKLFERSGLLERALGAASGAATSATKIVASLFDEPRDGLPIQVQIQSAPDPLAECEWALRTVLSEPQQPCAIFARDLHTYAPLLESAALRLGADLALSRRAPLLTNAFARVMLAALEFAASEDVQTLLPLLTKSYLRLDADQASRIRGVLRDCLRRRDTQWADLTQFAETNQEAIPWLKGLLRWREEVTGVNMPLHDWFTRLRDLEAKLPTPESAGVQGYAYHRDLHAKNQLMRELRGPASIANVTDAKPISLSRFAECCRLQWDAADVSMPRSEGRVPVIADPDQLTGHHTLIVLGMLEGVFPRRRTEHPVLSDRSREELSQLRPESPPLPDSRQSARGERDAFYQVCAGATDRLILSYPLADDQRDNVPAFYLEAAKEAAGGAEEIARSRVETFPPPDQCVSTSDRQIRLALDGPRKPPASNTLQAGAAKAAVTVADTYPFRPRELQDALQCAFLYAFRHRLDLEPNRFSTRWHRLGRIPEDVRLPLAADEHQARVLLESALNAELQDLAGDVPDWELRLMKTGGQRLIEEWLEREFAAREVWERTDGSVSALVPLNQNRDVLWDGIALSGTFAAVSEIGPYTVGHLYNGPVGDGSTSQTVVKNLRDDELLFLGLHLGALQVKERKAGLEIDNKRGGRTLYVFDTPGLGSRVQQNVQVVSLASGDDPVLGKKEFFDAVKALSRRAVARARTGAIDATPGDHCEFCDYGELCRSHREYGEMDATATDDEVVFDE
jgi:hypothetical protein